MSSESNKSSIYALIHLGRYLVLSLTGPSFARDVERPQVYQHPYAERNFTWNWLKNEAREGGQYGYSAIVKSVKTRHGLGDHIATQMYRSAFGYIHNILTLSRKKKTYQVYDKRAFLSRANLVSSIHIGQPLACIASSTKHNGRRSRVPPGSAQYDYGLLLTANRPSNSTQKSKWHTLVTASLAKVRVTL